jgi:hypothetical protein
MPVLAIHDEVRPGETINELLLELPDTIALKDLIRTRVREEVARANLERDRPRHLLVQPVDAETTLNGYRRPRKARAIDWQDQADIAIAAFGRNGFFVLVDGRQIESLDDEVALSPESEVRFLKLTPLVGG